MSLEDEVVLADIEVAGRLLTDSIARDSRFASCDLQDALDAARFSSHPYSTPPKEWPPFVDVVNLRELPPVLIERYNAAGGQGTALCGIQNAQCRQDEPLEITYSYWDGAGHRRVIQVQKGDTIAEFLRAVQQQLASEFREIRTASVENLLYVKEDLIIPHQHSFYELIINKARGKSGPLFHFDVHEDIRTIADATIEKDESHAGKSLSVIGMRKTSTFFQLQDGRFMTPPQDGSGIQFTVTEWVSEG